MKTVAVRISDGEVVAVLEPGQAATAFETDAFEVFTVDDKAVPLKEIVNSFGNGSPDRTTALTSEWLLPDPRLRASIPYAQELKIQSLKAWCSRYILTEYPIYKQMNIIGQAGYDENDLNRMRSFIDTVRDESNKIEAEIKTLDSNSEIVNFEYMNRIRNKTNNL